MTLPADDVARSRRWIARNRAERLTRTAFKNTICDHESNPTIQFSPRGGLVLTTGDDRIARLWLFPEFRELKQAKGYVSAVFAPNGRSALVSRIDFFVDRWDLASGARS